MIGTLHDPSGIKYIKSLPATPTPSSLRKKLPLDLLEARLDSLSIRSLPSSWPLPMIATARHPEEGGHGALSLVQRSTLLEKSLSWAAALDIELRSAREMKSLIATAHQHGRTVILSHHDFSATPTLTTLKKLASRASDQGADIFKIATHLRTPEDLKRLIDFQLEEQRIAITTMGMGNAGRFSRLVLCGFGAPLCYGWLGKPQVPGQWPALELTALLAGVLPA